MSPANPRRRARARTGAEELLDAQTERQHQATVEGLLRFYGWRYHHAPDNRPATNARGRAGRQRTGDRGFPDLIAVRRLDGHGPELLVAELKTERGRLGPGQSDWLEDLRAVAEGVTGLVDELLGWSAGAWTADQAPAVGVYLWRPSDVADGTVERVLAGPRGVGYMVDRHELEPGA